MRLSVWFFIVAVASCSSSELARLPPYSPNDAGPGLTPGIADSGLISPTIDTRIQNPDRKPDSQVSKRDSLPDQILPDLQPGLGGTCDLLRQNCSSKAEACYPISGKGEARCQPAGSVGEGGSCFLGADTPQCDLGLVCIQGVMQGGVCLVLCDVFDAVTICGVGSACQPLPFFTKVGYCLPG